MKPNLAVLIVLCGVLFVASCEWDEYQIQMTPRNGRLERQFTLIRHADNGPATLPADVVERLATAYGTKAPAGPTTQFAAKGVFGPAMPNDVGGAGRYQEFTTDMGNVGLYAERFRGNDDLNAQLDARRKAVNEAVDMMIGWLESELKAEPGWKDLRTFMNEQFRKDLANASTYCWTAGVSERMQPATQQASHPAVVRTPVGAPVGEDDSSAMMGHVMARLALYFAERGYFEAKDVAEIVEPHKFIHRLLATRMKQKFGEPAGAWAFLTSDEAMYKSLLKYLETTSQYKKLNAATTRATEAARDPNAFLVLGEPLSKAFSLSSVATPPSKVMMSLATPVAPMATNGVATEDGKQIRWELVLPEIGKDDVGPPPFAYAMWAEPAVRFQEQHFGKVILERQQLLDHVLRRQGLSAKDGGEWDNFVAGLKPDPGLAAKVEAFRFSSEPTAPPSGTTTMPSSKAKELTQGIVSALRATEGQTTRMAE